MQNEVNQKEKSEREKQIQYNITYMWNLEKMVAMNLLQSRSRDINLENITWILRGETKSGMNWDIEIDIYDIQTLLMCCAVRLVVSDSLQPRGLQPARLLCPWGFSGKELWSGLPYPPPGDLPNPRLSCIAGGFFTASATRLRSPTLLILSIKQILPGESRRHGA